MRRLKYHTPDELIKLNEIALIEVKVKKADKPEVMSKVKIESVLESCQKVKGNVYDKAAYLLQALVQKHPFASGNRRTAFLAVKDFLEINGAKLQVGNVPENSKVMLGIREGYYSLKEIKGWLKNGKIRKFER